jgi:hypothetical protein
MRGCGNYASKYGNMSVDFSTGFPIVRKTPEFRQKIRVTGETFLQQRGNVYRRYL